MLNQFFSVLLEDPSLGMHYQIISAAQSAELAQQDAEQFVADSFAAATPRVLATFAGILEPLTNDAPLEADNQKLLTAAALEWDGLLAKERMGDNWHKLDALTYEANSAPLVLHYAAGLWSLQVAATNKQSHFALLSDAVLEGNTVLEQMNASQAALQFE